MADPFQTERPDDPRGGFNASPEGCVNGTAWGGEITLDGSPNGYPNGPWETSTAERAVTDTSP